MVKLNKKKLLIGITGPDQGGFLPWLFTKYSIKFHKRDVDFCRITPSNEPRLPHDLSGLVIGGGSDLNPVMYGKNVLTLESLGQEKSLFQRFFARVRMRLKKEIGVGYVQMEPRRDEMEFNLLQHAIDKKIPVLGICRGAQMINVFFGGTLHQNIMSFKFENPNIRSIFAKKKIIIELSSKLSELLETNECYVNSLHKQAVDKLGENLVVSAKDINGVVQAVEHTSYPFMVGVQWHPEYLPQKKTQRKLFSKFLDEAIRICSYQ